MSEIGAAWAQWSLAASRVALNPQSLHLLFLCGQHRGRRPGAGGDKPTRLTTSSRVNGVGTIIHVRLEHRYAGGTGRYLTRRTRDLAVLTPAWRLRWAVFALARWMLPEERE